MSLHVVVGAGPVGAATARLLAARGERVRVVTRSGSFQHPGVESVAADVAEPGVLTRLATGAAALYNCANPRSYELWVSEWPPMAAAILDAAERTGAVLVTISNLYGYGPPDGPITEDTPLAATGHKGRLRAAMWQDALEAHRAGRLRAVEARAADYFGPAVVESHVGKLFVPRLLAGRPAMMFGNPDLPHSVTYAPDAARALAILGTEQRAWGRAWHVPTHDPMTLREFASGFCRSVGAPEARIRSVGSLGRRILGRLNPRMREFGEIAYQTEVAFVLDSSAFVAEFGIAPTPLVEAYQATAQWWRVPRTPAAAARSSQRATIPASQEDR